jgi:hypothetical protein
MKFKSFLKDIALREIGDTTDGYNWQMIQDKEEKEVYQFYTEKHKYNVLVEYDKENPKYSSIHFGLANKPDEEKYSTITNEGNHFKIMATVLEIGEHTLLKNEELTGFLVAATPRKIKLYRQFVENQFPNAKVEVVGSSLRIEI